MHRVIRYVESNNCIFKTEWYRRINCIISKYTRLIDEIDTLIDEFDSDDVTVMIYLRVYVWTKSMLSVTSSKESSLIELMFSIIES